MNGKMKVRVQKKALRSGGFHWQIRLFRSAFLASQAIIQILVFAIIGQLRC